MPKSYPWPGVVGGTGAGADSGRYNAPEWWAVWAAQQQAGGLIVPDVAAPLRTLSAWANIGVYYGIPNQLEVTDGGGFVADVDTGGALVDGQFFYEDEGRSLTMPASQTYYVVVRKNYTAAAYSPPGYAAGDGIVPAYTARITWVSALVQSTDRSTYWDIPLATVVTDGAEITSVTDTREWVDSYTMYEWVTPYIVYNVTGAANVDVTYLAGMTGWPTPDSAGTQAFGRTVIPNRTIAGVAIDSIWMWQNPTSPDIYVRNSYSYGGCTDQLSPVAGSYAVQTLEATYALTCYETSLAALMNFGVAGDLLELNTSRDATDPLDTANAAVYFLGWRLSYLVSK